MHTRALLFMSTGVSKEPQSTRAGAGTEVAAQIWKALWEIWDLSWAWKEGKEVFGNVKERDERYSR